MKHVLIDWPARAALLPLLAAQALQVRTRALRLPEAEGPRAGRIGQGQPLRLLILGDSSAAGVGAPHQDQALAGQLVARLSPHVTVDWELHARTGDLTRDALRRLDRIAGPFDAVLVALGVNDTTRFLPRPVWLAQQQRLIERLTGEFGARHVILTGLPPLDRFPLLPQPLRWTLGRHAARLDDGLRKLAAAHPACDVLTFDLPDDPALMAEDGFHPSPATYAIWAGMAADRILARL